MRACDVEKRGKKEFRLVFANINSKCIEFMTVCIDVYVHGQVRSNA